MTNFPSTDSLVHLISSGVPWPAKGVHLAILVVASLVLFLVAGRVLVALVDRIVARTGPADDVITQVPSDWYHWHGKI